MKNSLVIQFRVVLLGVLPMIWRRFLISSDATFWDLHVAIQDAMGWEDRHLHQFRVAKLSSGHLDSIGIPDPGGPSPFLPGWNIRLDEYLGPDMPLFLYEYDFGDSWLHEVVLERIFETDKPFPVCTEGEGDC
ncbi:MAG: plasmid pRiA4b ORF-3 family protein, partial [Candidatus Eisenbacteria bacterium]|nr:plasmid pRiA4b ORF-3 family protein [Candidatus Eisenbacteria bacterium]